MTFAFAMYMEHSSKLYKSIQNVYSGANNTEEGLSPTKSILCVYVYKMYTFCGVFWLGNLLVYLLFFL